MRGERAIKNVQTPTLREERLLWQQGHSLVAGVDEAGRGPLAGPVVAAAVILHPQQQHSWSRGLRDSKQMSPEQRLLFYERIHKEAWAVGVGVVSAQIIDEVGILRATKMAMTQALANLWVQPDAILIDALTLPKVEAPQKGLIKGDSRCLSIAAASIVAKVSRDGLMADYDGIYPGYGFARHKGYATPEHLRSLQRLGPCPIHRRSFAPVRDVLRGPGWFDARDG